MARKKISSQTLLQQQNAFYMASIFAFVFFVLSIVLAESYIPWRAAIQTEDLHYLSTSALGAIVLFFTAFITYKHKKVNKKALRWNRNLFLWTGSLSVLILSWLSIFKTFSS